MEINMKAVVCTIESANFRVSLGPNPQLFDSSSFEPAFDLTANED